jgi:hypothetical protein
MTALPTTAASLNTHFGALLAAVRAIRPKCPDCGHPLDDSGLDVRTRENDAGQQERVCRPCFHGEIAEMQMAHPLR